ncbi:hypothetical protein BCR44DRAFT_133881 [Catenaria anguillulae PL171]|uniref:JmjC domain-containing protein n=1 Tax=Catenaria anguillulae PL171 TaxID=765915 RepID=A0A1Y2HWC8_9FUNG|nr:hypothetical protein BCR44DRAFT_133881 [Catenaria anguillulae PL171]
MIVTGFPLARTNLMAVVYQLHDVLPAPPPVVSPMDPGSSRSDQISLSPSSCPGSIPVSAAGLHRFSPVREVTLDDSFSPSVYRDLIQAPFVIRDAIQHWPALQLWTLEYLNKSAGHRLVPVELGSTYLDSAWSQSLMTLNQFLRVHVMPAAHRVQSDDDDDEPATVGYLAQYNLFALLPHLRSHTSIPDQIHRRTTSSTSDAHTPKPSLDSTDAIRINAWFGPRGTVTPLHHDGNLNNMFAQVVGSKRVVLFPPSDSHLLADLDGMLHNTSSVDVRKWPEEVEARLELAQAHGVEAVCRAGDLLYIPPNYWHHVESLATSFSVSFWF